MLTAKWLKINSRLQPFQLVYSSEAAFLHCLAYCLLFLLKNGANIEYKSLWCAIPILLIQYPWRAAPLLHYSTQVSLSKRRGFIKYKALASITVSSLNSSTHSQMPYAISASACVCVSSHFHTQTQNRCRCFFYRLHRSPQIPCQTIYYPKPFEH